MAGWEALRAVAPRIVEIFERRHRATGNLCLLGTLRADGFPRISPMEPRFSQGDLWLFGMPGTSKFTDLARDPRFTLHTATVDTHVGDGDAKVWGTVRDVQAPDLHERLAQEVYDDSGFDIRGSAFDHCYRAEVVGAAAVEVVDGRLEIVTWRAGGVQRVVVKR